MNLNFIQEVFIESITKTLEDKFNMGAFSFSYLSWSYLINLNFNLSAIIGGFTILVSLSAILKNGIESYKTWKEIKKQEKLDLIKELESVKQLENKND